MSGLPNVRVSRALPGAIFFQKKVRPGRIPRNFSNLH